MKVLVCDACQEDVDRVAALLAEPCRKVRAQITVASQPEELDDLSGFDLAFLDIDMKEAAGSAHSLAPAFPRKREGVRGYFLFCADDDTGRLFILHLGSFAGQWHQNCYI